MKKTALDLEVTKDGTGCYYGRAHADEQGNLYVKFPGPLGMTFTRITQLEGEGYEVHLVDKIKKGGKKNVSAQARAPHRCTRKT